MTKDTIDARLWSRVNRDGPIVRAELGPCWLYEGRKLKSGYGVVPSGKKHVTVLAHRAAAQAGGRRLAPREVVMHRCDNPPCVRPAHLVVGTTAENNADMRNKGRGARGATHGRHRLSVGQVVEIRERRARGELGRVIAADMGIRESQVSRIATGKRWRHL